VAYFPFTVGSSSIREITVDQHQHHVSSSDLAVTRRQPHPNDHGRNRNVLFIQVRLECRR